MNRSINGAHLYNAFSGVQTSLVQQIQVRLSRVFRDLKLSFEVSVPKFIRFF